MTWKFLQEQSNGFDQIILYPSILSTHPLQKYANRYLLRVLGLKPLNVSNGLNPPFLRNDFNTHIYPSSFICILNGGNDIAFSGIKSFTLSREMSTISPSNSNMVGFPPFTTESLKKAGNSIPNRGSPSFRVLYIPSRLP